MYTHRAGIFKGQPLTRRERLITAGTRVIPIERRYKIIQDALKDKEIMKETPLTEDLQDEIDDVEESIDGVDWSITNLKTSISETIRVDEGNDIEKSATLRECDTTINIISDIAEVVLEKFYSVYDNLRNTIKQEQVITLTEVYSLFLEMKIYIDIFRRRFKAVAKDVQKHSEDSEDLDDELVRNFDNTIIFLRSIMGLKTEFRFSSNEKLKMEEIFNALPNLTEIDFEFEPNCICRNLNF